MQCKDFEATLEQRVGEPLPPEAAAHLNDCGPCRGIVADLGAIESAARELGAEAEPPERIWLSLRAQLEAEGLIRSRGPSEEKSGWFAAWLGMLPRPALAGAYLSFLFAAALLIGLQSSSRPDRAFLPSNTLPAIEAARTQISAEERGTVQTSRERDPEVSASLRRNLAVVDNFIALCEKSVREEPQNDLAREYLYGAYQQKAELLATMTERGTVGD